MAIQGQGPFVPTSNVWDVSQLYSTEVTSPAFKELLVRLYQNVNNIALLLNIKDTGVYSVDEYVNGQTYFMNPALSSSTAQSPAMRQVFRKTINFGALPNTATKSVAHGLTPTANWSFTRIYACASDPTNLDYVPIPYVSSSGTDNLELYVDATNVNIVSSSDWSSFTVTYVILEYIKN